MKPCLAQMASVLGVTCHEGVFIFLHQYGRGNITVLTVTYAHN